METNTMHAPRLHLSLVGVSLFAISGSPTPVLGNHGRGQGVIVTSSETILTVPTSYVAPTSAYSSTSLVFPTSYAMPTVYPTSYVVPSVYPTSYVSPTYSLSPTAYLVPTYSRAGRPWARRRLFERPIFTETSYYWPTASYIPTSFYPSSVIYPTSVVYPTVRDYQVVTSSARICDETMPAMSAVAADSFPETTSRVPRATRSPGPSQTPAPIVNSQPAPSAEGPTGERTGSGDVPSNPATPAQNTTPPLPQAPAMRNTAAPMTPTPDSAQPGGRTPELGPQPADSGPLVLPPEPVSEQPEEAVRREARRPVGLSVPRASRNILEGKVVSGEGGQAEENVRVTVSNRAGAFVDRTDTTDAYGRYAIRVPDGDWTVKVSMPSGRVHDVYQLTVSGDQITDDRGEAVASLTITR